jgi:hypothetical protein
MLLPAAAEASLYAAGMCGCAPLPLQCASVIINAGTLLLPYGLSFAHTSGCTVVPLHSATATAAASALGYRCCCTPLSLSWDAATLLMLPVLLRSAATRLT